MEAKGFTSEEDDEDEEKKPIKDRKASEDMNKNFDDATLSVWENFKINWQCYLGIFTAFASTLLTFPVLMFKLDFHLPAYIQFAYITFIFNLGDTVSRYVYSSFKMLHLPSLHLLNIIKLALVYVNYISIGSQSVWLNSHLSRFLIVFVQAFLGGYILMAHLDISVNNFKSIFDRNRTGLLNSFSVQIGLTAGAVLSLLW